jgi:hypothetical protein
MVRRRSGGVRGRLRRARRRFGGVRRRLRRARRARGRLGGTSHS